MITYKTNDTWPGLEFPVLHKVVYARRTNTWNAWHPNIQDHWVDEWLRTNCRSSCYRSPGWQTEKFIQFEDDADATAFALKWAV